MELEEALDVIQKEIAEGNKSLSVGLALTKIQDNEIKKSIVDLQYKIEFDRYVNTLKLKRELIDHRAKFNGKFNEKGFDDLLGKLDEYINSRVNFLQALLGTGLQTLYH